MGNASRRVAQTLSESAYAAARLVSRMTPPDLKRFVFRLKPPSVIWHMPDRGMVFVQIPKVATMSMRAALAAYAAGLPTADLSELPPHEAAAVGRYQRNAYPPEIRRLGRDCFTFGFVRNPLDRLVSAYADKVLSTPNEAHNLFRRHGISLDASFPEFVDAVAGLSDDHCDVHLRSQYRFISDRSGCVVDFVGRFEHLGADWGVLMDRFGFPALPQRNVSTHTPYTEVYTRALARRVAERYRRDIDLFGYEDEVARLT